MTRHKVQTVRDVHGPRHAELRELADVFAGFLDEIASHMQKEEQILFPMIRRLDAGEGSGGFHCGSVGNPIRMMVMEHDQASAALAQMRALTHGFTPPADACPTYRVMLAGLATLERDMHTHIAKENDSLFPRAVACEAG